MKRSLSPRRSNVKANLSPKENGQAKLLLAWYDKHRRSMPWRALPGLQPNPYYVWLSEIMLQQTTVVTVGPYFQRFIERWPTLEAFITASLDDIMQMWAGLGYYRRARLLYQCAQYIKTEGGGHFPQTYEQLLDLPGFGPYTAAAVAAIAFNQRANVVDGNVERVVCRLFALREPLTRIKSRIRFLAEELLPGARYGDYAQGLMDLGATICTPVNPKCDLCPWKLYCQSNALGLTNTLPRRLKAVSKPIRRTFAFVLYNKKKALFLRKREAKGLLGGMMEVPTSCWINGPMPSFKDVLSEAPIQARWSVKPGYIRHVFSHFELQVTIATATVNKDSIKKLDGRWVAYEDLANEALPSLMRKIIHAAQESI